ncbi:MAG: hypothetical protein JRS35_22690 [Deltaproteobacteria bacterium]|nr:hypothetical protein [Deltaproteobacteria bacterium]
MAYLVRRPGGKLQIRECMRTRRGPRSRMLASFRGALNDQVLGQAARKAVRPFDREDLIAKAQAMGVGWTSSTNVAARQLVRRLRRGRTLDPVLVGLLRKSLADMQETELADDLDEAADWVGTSDEERGAALRGLLRLSDAIVRSRDAPSPRDGEAYPHIDSEQRGAA